MEKRKFHSLTFILCALSLISCLSLFSYAQKETKKPEILKFKEVISNPKYPNPKDGRKKKIVFKEELSIGVVEGDENYMFDEFVFFNTDDQGNFYVIDFDKRRIQKYNPEGKYILSIGREGQGPGEFQAISIPRFDKNGHLYITDYGNLRISFFDTDGKYLKQLNIPGVLENLYMNSRGYFISSFSSYLENGYRIVFGLFDDQFNVVQEFHSRTNEFEISGGRDLTSRAKFTASILNQIVFQPRPVYTVTDNDYIYFGYPEDYTIDIYSPDGIPLRTIKREYDSIKVGEKDKEYFVENIAKPFMGNRPEDYKKEVVKFIEYPKYKPAYYNFTLMENGWLAVVVEFIEGEYTLFDLFDEEGIYIGNFKANIAPETLFFKNGKAYTVATENDYKFVKRYSFEIQEYEDSEDN